MSTSSASTPLHDADDEALLQRLAHGKRTGDLDQAREAMHHLLFRHERRMRRRVGLRLPEHLAHHEDTVATWVLERVMRSALMLGLEGTSVGEWVRWYGTVIDRQVVSFFRTAQGQALEQEAAVEVGARSDDDAAPRYEPVEEPDEERAVAQICHTGLVQDVLGRMENQMHVAVIQDAFFEDRPSAEVAARHGTTAANVDRIKTRFREAVREECGRVGVTGT